MIGLRVAKGGPGVPYGREPAQGTGLLFLKRLIVFCNPLSRLIRHPSVIMKSPFRFAAFAFIAGVSPLAAATFPYTNDFSGTGANTAFTTETTNAEWNVTGGAYQYSYTNTTLMASSASLVLTGATGVNFQMETQFTVSSTGTINSTQTIGFGLFGNDAAFTGSGSGTSYYLADFMYANSGTPGNLRIIALGDTSGVTNTPTSVDDNAGSSNLAVNLGTTYTLRLIGTYSGSTLNMTLGVFDAAGTTQIGTSATAMDTSVLAGTNFGLRNRTGIGGGTVSVAFDNFSVTAAAVPEPGAAAAVLGSLALLAAFGARRGLRR